MSEQERRPHEACDHYAPLLAMLDDLPAQSETFSAEERTAAREHLADCARCQADQRAYARLTGDLRRAFGPAAAAPLRTSDLLAAIGATREPAAPARAATPARRDAIRSVIYLGDFDGGFDRMSEQDERTDDNGAQTTSGRKMAAIPSLRPGPRERAVGRRRWAAAFSATAAAVALIVVAVTLFASHARPTATATHTAHAAATQTASAQAQKVEAIGPILAVGMDSPTDGWAISQVTHPPDNQPEIALYHFDGSRWSLTKLPQSIPFSGMNSPTIQLLSARDGWIVDGRYLLHYNGSTWNQVNITLAGNEQITQVMALDMLTPTLGWAAVGLDTAGANAPKIGFVRYDGQQWTLEPSNFTLAGLNPDTVAITSLSATMSNDVWAVGTDFVSVPEGTSTSEQAGFVFHRVNGVWLLATTLNQPHAATSLLPQGILMTSPTNGWIIGSSVTLKQTSNGTDETSRALLLHYDFHQTGTRWVPVDAPIANPSGGDSLQQIVANGQNNIWVSGGSAGAQITPGRLPITSLLLHYDGAKWTQITPSFDAIDGVNSGGIFNLALAPDGTLWTVGALERVQGSQGDLTPFFSFYSNGVWSIAPPISGK